MRLVLLITITLLLGGCVTTVEVNHYPNVNTPPPTGFYSDTEKQQRARDLIGRVIRLSRGEILQGSSHANTAGVVERRLKVKGWFICRQQRQYGMIVVFCARHRKLQRYVDHSNIRAFMLSLQENMEGISAPVYIDWGR